MVVLSDGPKQFIDYACAVTGLNDICRHADLVPGVTICFTDFIWLMYKFTRKYKHKVELEGILAPAPDGQLHYLVLTGVRDADLRNTGKARFLPASQKKAWSCILEDALNYGISDEDIRQFRHSLNLYPEHGITDREFFQPAPDKGA